jgi:sucrose-6-phosphate hydrolase SacC (GH32 family)
MHQSVFVWAFAIAALLTIESRAADDLLVADFEANDYGAWKVEGEAFGPGPARGTLPNQQKVSGYQGQGLVNTYYKGDNTRGALTSPPLAVERKYLNFLIGGGNRPGEAGINLLLDGKVVRTATGDDDEKLTWATWDLSDLVGKQVVIQIVDQADGGWGHVNVDQIVQSDAPKAEVHQSRPVVTDKLYDETYRPQFHFTAKSGWLNDPNGLVFDGGRWHLFFQHNPFGTKWGNMTWGHAVSTDLFHWQQWPNALEPDELGTMFSGSAVIDRDNTAGFGRGAMVVLYTAAGGTSPASKGKPFTQCLAYSTDGGRTMTKFPGNPVLRHIAGGNRDPKVFWHAPTKRWIMALFVEPREGGRTVNTIQFFASPNLKDWTFLSRIDDFFECPDCFELPIDADAMRTKWVLFGADGNYALGTFDGEKFVKESGKFRGDFGPSFYAAQTYSDAPEGRRILIGWMRDGRYPQMPFNQQMGIPTELTLRTTPDGVRMFKWPVRELATLVTSERPIPAGPVTGKIALTQTPAELLDIEAEFEPGEAGISFDFRGLPVRWRDGKLTVGTHTAQVKPLDGKLALRILVDRASVEVFANRGLVTVSHCFLPKRDAEKAEMTVEGDSAKVVSMRARELRSAWK